MYVKQRMLMTGWILGLDRDSNSQRRGVKVYGGQPVKAGGIIVRQLGTKVPVSASKPVLR